nr:MAG: capsid protein [Cressdnaviricota sp.]
MFGQFRLARNYTGEVTSGNNTWAKSSRGPAAAGAVITLDSQGFGSVLVRTFTDTMNNVMGAGSTGNYDPMVVTGVLPTLNPAVAGSAPSDHLNKVYCAPSRMEVQISNTGTAPASGSVYLLRMKQPCNTTTTSLVPTVTGPSDPLSVANFMYSLYEPSPGSGSITHQMTVFQPHTSFMKAPGFHKFFETIDYCQFKLAHGAEKTCHLQVPGSSLNPPLDFARSVPVFYNGVQFYAVPGYDLFVVVQLLASPPVAYSSAAATGSVEGGVAAVLVSYRWLEKWSVVQRRKGWVATTYVASGNSVSVPATSAAGYAVMNQFGTAASNSNAPIL